MNLTSLTSRKTLKRVSTVILASLLAMVARNGMAEDFESIKAAAKKEGSIVFWASAPRQHTTDALVDMFNKRFDMNIKIDRVALRAPDIAARLTEHANGSVAGSDVTYTATATQAKHANYRIVARFDAEQGTDTKDVCKSAFGPTPAARYADRTNLFMAFCDQAEPIAGAKVSGPKLAGLSDPNLREMLRAGMQAMFPSATNSGRTGSMGSIQVNPVPHFRLNPLDGII